MMINKKTFPVRAFLVVLLLLDLHCLYLFKYSGIIEKYLGGNNKYWVLGAVSILLLIFYRGLSYTKNPMHKSTFLNAFMPVIIACALIMLINASISYPLQSINDTLRICGHLFWYAQAFLYYYLFTKDGSENKVIKIFNIICTVWYIILILQYISGNSTGRFLFDFASIYPHKVLYRNGSIRANMFSLPNLMIIYNFYQLYSEKKLLNKRAVTAAVRFLLGIFCLLFVQQTRGYTLAVFAALAVITLFLNENSNKKLRSAIIIALVVVYAASTGVVTDFFSTFNESSDMGGSTTYRLLAIEYYWHKFLDNPIFGGVGFAAEEFYYGLVHSASGRCYIDDVGIFGSLAMYGLLIIVLYFIPLVRIIIITFHLRTTNHNQFVLLLSIVAFMLLTTGSLIMINKERMFTLPLIMALAEYFETQRVQKLKSIII